MRPEIKERWVAALRSGDYVQGKDYLQRDGKYCCLGVLCDLHAQATGNQWKVMPGHKMAYNDNELYAAQEALEWAGLTDEQGRVLATLNDGNAHFHAIAYAIEKLF